MSEPSLYDDLFRLERIRTDETFAQSVYAALCNMRWAHPARTEPWFCTWRSAGAIVGEIRDCESGDYMDWYCSGILTDGTPEGLVTDEVAAALAAFGWKPSPWPEDDE